MRLVTRGNLDGLTCAVLIDHAERIEEVQLARAEDVTDETFSIDSGDILASLPYHPQCLKWFDHHSTTRAYSKPPLQFEGRYGLAPSTARLVYDYYLHDNPGFTLYDDLLRETDRYDSARLTLEDLTDPEGYVLLGFTLDPMDRSRGFADYFMLLLETFREDGIEEVMALPEVQSRIRKCADERERFLAAMRKHSRLEDRVIVTDLREAGSLPPGNRYLVYTLFPDAQVSLRIAWGPEREFVVADAGHSIFNPTSPVHVGGLMSRYGGGGYKGAGTTPLERERADELIRELIAKLNKPAISASP